MTLFDVFHLPDSAFHEIFSFFESYIFTITENTAYDLNLEVSPELLGRMYEGMINARDMNDLDAQKGIVYTEPAEINFMARRSFVEVLWRKKDLPEFERLKNLDREFLYHFVFDAIEQKKAWLRRTQADTETLHRAICAITACDPACGSGSMLLGVLQLQMELLKAIDEFEGKLHSDKHDFELKKQLISECLYGVDVKEWAVRIAELRLWLYMIEEAEFSQEELTQSPLLPNLDFKLRCGNSLLSKIGEQDFSLTALRSKKNLNSAAAVKLTAFIEKKRQFIVNKAPESTFEKLKAAEGEVFKAFIKERIAELERELKSASKNIVQTAMFEVEEKDLFAASRAALAKEIEALKALSKDIDRRKSLPFSYDLDFMEIFLAKDDPGFDLIIGNPPYVRQEGILPPDDGEYLEELLETGSKEEKARINKLQKAALNNKVFETYPFLNTSLRTLIDGKNKTVALYGDKVPGRSDLYVYFQLLCPQYLNSNGIFCFIISNSWLDVEYGAFVQHFLLKHTRLLAIYDCNVRSFNASVNTVIYLHSALTNTETFKLSSYYKTLEPPEQPVRFVMNKIDYTLAADADWLIEQEQTEHNTFRTSYRVITQSQKSLYRAGYNEESKSYDGDKWGGKYLRAPEIYYTILEKGKDKLVRLGDIAEVRFGIKTGANEFFYLTPIGPGSKLGLLRVRNGADWEGEIEEEFLRKAIVSPRDSKMPGLLHKNINTFVLICHKTKKELKQTQVIKYIEWGERQGYNKRKTCAARKVWYDLGENHDGSVLWAMMHSKLHNVYFNINRVQVDHNLFEIIPSVNGSEKALFISCISPVAILTKEVFGRSYGGGSGPIKNEGVDIEDFKLLNPQYIHLKGNLVEQYTGFVKREMNEILMEYGFDDRYPIRDQRPNPLPDRKALDDIIFDALGLTPAERNEVYWSVAELVKQRLDKAATR